MLMPNSEVIYIPDIWMDVDTALAEVPVNLLPLLDDTTFKDIEAAIAYNAAGMALYWHFVTPAGAYTVTAVTPTTGGDYDWTDQGDAGIYTIEIPASGGASINNDTEGFGWFTGKATGVLPWRGPVIGFRRAALNDLMIENAFSATRALAGTALPDAAADAAGGLPISDAGGLDLDTYIKRLEAAITAAILARIDENISAAKTLTAAYDAAKSAAPAGAKMDIVDAPNSTAVTAIQAGLAKPSDIPSAGSVADAVLDEALGSHTGFLTGLLTAAGYTAPPSVGDIANAVWGAATRSLTEKTGFSLSVTPPTAQNIWEYATRALTDKSGFSGSGTVTDKTGFSLAVTPPTAGDIASAVWGAVTRSLTDKADFSLSTAGILAIWHQLLTSIATAGSIGKLIKDNLDAKVSEVGGGSLTAESIRIEMDANSKLANLPADPADQSAVEAAIAAAHATTDSKIDSITGGGLTEKTYTLTDASTGLPLAGVQVWATTDEAGLNQVDITRTTNDAGQVTFRFNLAAGTPIYIWNRYMAEGDAPDEEEV